MRINKYVAGSSALSRRGVDQAIAMGRITVNGVPASVGQEVTDKDIVAIDGQVISSTNNICTIMLHKPVGYVVSRNGQGSRTIYDLLPAKFHGLKPIGRLDKDSSGLLLMTNDGQLVYELTHPKFIKQKVYEVRLNKDLNPADQANIERGVILDDGLSKLRLSGQGRQWTVKISEGRNRQIRRTFAAKGYQVTRLHRTNMGGYRLGDLAIGKFNTINP